MNGGHFFTASHFVGLKTVGRNMKAKQRLLNTSFDVGDRCVFICIQKSEGIVGSSW